MPKMLIAVDSPGAAEFIYPVIPFIKKNNDILLITVKESPAKILKKYFPIRCDKEKQARIIYANFNPDILLVGTSSLVLGPYINNLFTKLAAAGNKKIIAFQDYWANHRTSVNFPMMKHWQAILAPDDLAKKFILEDGYQGNIVVAGHPGYDKLQKLNLSGERKNLRGKLHLSEKDFVIIYIGRGTPQSWAEDEIAFRFFARTIQSLKQKVITIIKPHPRDEDPQRYQRIAPLLKTISISTISNTNLLPVTDLIIGPSSTSHIHACYLRIPAVCLVLPDGDKKRLEKISLNDFPPNTLGATIGIYKESATQLKNIIENIKTNSNFLLKIKEAQERYFPIYKDSAAQKVAEAIQLIIQS